MTSQQEGDRALAEHRAVMAIFLRECIGRPTEAQYEEQLVALRSAMAWDDTKASSF